MKLFSEFIKQHDFIESEFQEVFQIRNLYLSSGFLDILESKGLFTGKEDIVDLLIKEITYHYLHKDDNFTLTFDKDKFKKINNIFFDKIIINCSNKIPKNSASYKIDKDIKLNNDKLINEIVINIGRVEDEGRLLSIIAHEIKHAWQQYQALLNNSDWSMFEITNSEVYKNIICSAASPNIVNEIAGQILYLCHKFEQDAFYSQFAEELKHQIKDDLNITQIQDYIKYFKQNQTFNQFITYYKYLNNFNSGVLSKVRNKFLDKINSLSKKNYTWNSFYNKHNKLLSKSIQKMCNIGANIYWENETNKREIYEQLYVPDKIQKHIKEQLFYKSIFNNE